MIRNIVLFSMAFCITLFLFTGYAHAYGIGGYVVLGGGDTAWESDDDYYTTYSDDSQDSFFGFGFILDTAVADDSLLNYRLNLGVEYWTMAFDKEDDDLSLTKLVITNTLGFGMMREDSYRIWLGPQLRVAAGGGEFDESGDTWDQGEIGIGLAFGINFHITKFTSLCLEGGIVAMGKWATWDWESSTMDVYGEYSGAYLSAAILGRFE
jgi:hypothetical protein